MSLLSDDDLHWFNEGTHSAAWEKLGAHPLHDGEATGTWFAVWAPNARAVSVIGDFNRWNPASHPLRPRATSGIWDGFVRGVGTGTVYKYHIVSRSGQAGDKADPFGFQHQVPPLTASVVTRLDYAWGDAVWMAERAAKNAHRAPISIYEVHLGSWRRVREEGHRSLSYRELARPLTEHVLKMGFTHVEMLPVMEHPFFGSWGYQVTGYFAPTHRYGSPQDLMFLIDTLHQHGIGVILDWVPSHFPTDAHGLAYFDGTHLFEHEDPRIGFHQDWKSYIFDYGRPEVRSFLLSSALFWLREYHADALRVDAVASMLYRDYSRKAGEWVPNRYGGRENLEAIDFLRQLNSEVYRVVPQAQVIAEESTAWPMVSRPVYLGGLGFGMKWDMGWMHDTLAYFARDPIHRTWHHHQITFRMMYAFSENFVLPLSHDEVVHGKGSLIGRMPGDAWRKFANLRVMFAYMFTQPGKKLLFMGGEFGQVREWNHDDALDWHLLESPLHAGLQHFVADLNALYCSQPAAHDLDFEREGYEWIDPDDVQNSVLTYLRLDGADQRLLVIINLTPLMRSGYRVGVPFGGTWAEILNSDAELYGGSGAGNYGEVVADAEPSHGRPFSLLLTLPPLSALILAARSPGSPQDQPAASDNPPAAESRSMDPPAA